MTIITLTTDFGLADSYVGIMKGVIFSIAPHAHVVDLTHNIAPQNLRQAAYALDRAMPFFPSGTIHVAVVDPGVGSARRALLVTTEQAFFVGPDNGLFSQVLAGPTAQAWDLDQPRFWLPEVSRTFHGRDVFAPVAAHLAQGVSPDRLGHPISDPVRLVWAMPTQHPDGHLSGEVIYVDGFGNLISNIPGDWIRSDRWQCEIAGHILPLSSTYAEVAVGTLAALVSSGGSVEIAVRNGNAAQRLGVSVGAPLAVRPVASSQ